MSSSAAEHGLSEFSDHRPVPRVPSGWGVGEDPSPGAVGAEGTGQAWGGGRAGESGAGGIDDEGRSEMMCQILEEIFAFCYHFFAEWAIQF